MKISFNWLKDYIPTILTVEEVADILTNTGLEVEGIEDYTSVKGGLNGFCLGLVQEVTQHPDADRLKLTKVDVGGPDLLDIVCGAPNVAKGQKVAVAMVGCEIHPKEGDSFKIKKSKIRGAVSQGMLCAEDELGLSEEHDGIMVLDTEKPPGTPLNEVLEIYEDKVIEIGLTPNRSDAISHIGVARDLAAFLNMSESTVINRPDSNIQGASSGKVKVHLDDKDGCIRYSGIEIEDIKVGPSPPWLQNKLKAIGLSPINNVVDITNYVMHETGQPLHAFDRAMIKDHEVRVRRAKKNEKFKTLDGEDRSLDMEDLMICDSHEGMCIAGVFGGEKSGVSDRTSAIFLESACFEPVSTRKTAKRHGLNTDSSFRFERGVDPNGTLFALQRAALLIAQNCSGVLASEFLDIYPEKVEPRVVDLDLNKAFSLIGQSIDRDEVKKILASLDIKVLQANADTWSLQIPTYRVDVTREADVVEEILRIYGFNRVNIPQDLKSSIVAHPRPDKHNLRKEVSVMLGGMGFHEIMCNSLTASSYASLINEKHSIGIRNPLSQDLGVLRQTLIWGALQTVAYNQNRQMPDFKGFEFGSIYKKTSDGFIQDERVSLFLTGAKKEENWAVSGDKTSFYDLSAIVQLLLKKVGVVEEIECQPLESPLFSQGLAYNMNSLEVARLGQVSDQMKKLFDLKDEVYYAELDWNFIAENLETRTFKVKDIPKFPAVRRDLSLLLDKSVEYGRIEALSRKAGGVMLKNMGLFDVYEGKNLPEGKKSYALNFILQDESRTLTDKVVDKVMGKIQKSLESKLGAELRQ